MADDSQLRATSSSLPVGTWKIDARRSSIGFEAPNLRVRRVRGRLTDVHGVIDVQDGGAATAAGTAASDSIDTGNAWRDRHLRGKTFLHVAEHPEIELSVDEFAGHGDHLHADAAITIRGVQRQIPLTVQVVSGGADLRELHLRATGTLNREDFGIRVSTFMVGAHIEVDLDLRADRTD